MSADGFSDREILALYGVLVGASWENADNFEVCQQAWKAITRAWGVDVKESRISGRSVVRS